MGLNQIMKLFGFCMAMFLVSCVIGVSSQCNGELESCSHGLCSDKCETSNVSGSGVEIIVIIMSISVALIIGLVIVLVTCASNKDLGLRMSTHHRTRTPHAIQARLWKFPSI